MQSAVNGLVRVGWKRNVEKRSQRSSLVGLNEEFEFGLVNSKREQSMMR